MARAYWIGCYRAVSHPDKLAAYGALARPAIEAHGGIFLARGGVARTFEAGQDERTVLIEFPSVDAAVAAYESPAYRAALDVFDGAAVRDIRIVQGL